MKEKVSSILSNLGASFRKDRGRQGSCRNTNGDREGKSGG